MPAWQPDDLLDKHEAAEHLGITVATWRNHLYSRGAHGPKPDGVKGGNRNAWKRSTLDTWRAAHPAAATRTETPHG